jgi:ribosomal protein S18 acetylase RimI-like enzyme
LLGAWQVQHAAFGPDDAYDWFVLLNLLTTPRNINLRAAAGRYTLAYLAGEFDTRGDRGWVVSVSVHPKWQGLGMGSALLAAAHTQFAARTGRVHLTVRQHNTRAIRIYERHGYRHVSTFTRYYRDGEDGLVMEKLLA